MYENMLVLFAYLLVSMPFSWCLVFHFSQSHPLLLLGEITLEAVITDFPRNDQLVLRCMNMTKTSFSGKAAAMIDLLVFKELQDSLSLKRGGPISQPT